MVVPAIEFVDWEGGGLAELGGEKGGPDFGGGDGEDDGGDGGEVGAVEGRGFAEVVEIKKPHDFVTGLGSSDRLRFEERGFAGHHGAKV